MSVAKIPLLPTINVAQAAAWIAEIATAGGRIALVDGDNIPSLSKLTLPLPPRTLVIVVRGAISSLSGHMKDLVRVTGAVVVASLTSRKNAADFTVQRLLYVGSRLAPWARFAVLSQDGDFSEIVLGAVEDGVNVRLTSSCEEFAQWLGVPPGEHRPEEFPEAARPFPEKAVANEHAAEAASSAPSEVRIPARHKRSEALRLCYCESWGGTKKEFTETFGINHGNFGAWLRRRAIDSASEKAVETWARERDIALGW